MSKIKDYILARSIFPLKKIWLPMFVTVGLSYKMIMDYIEPTLNIHELVSMTLFQLIFISWIWVSYLFDKEYMKLNDYIKKNGNNNHLLFEEDHEKTFQKKIKEHGIYILILIVVLLLVEGFRFLRNTISITSSVKLTLFLGLLVFSVASYGMTIFSHKRLIAFLKSITIEKSLGVYKNIEY